MGCERRVIARCRSLAEQSQTARTGLRHLARGFEVEGAGWPRSSAAKPGAPSSSKLWNLRFPIPRFNPLPKKNNGPRIRDEPRRRSTAGEPHDRRSREASSMDSRMRIYYPVQSTHDWTFWHTSLPPSPRSTRWITTTVPIRTNITQLSHAICKWLSR